MPGDLTDRLRLVGSLVQCSQMVQHTGSRQGAAASGVIRPDDDTGRPARTYPRHALIAMGPGISGPVQLLIKLHSPFGIYCVHPVILPDAWLPSNLPMQKRIDPSTHFRIQCYNSSGCFQIFRR